MKINQTPLGQLQLAETEKQHDERGTFARLFCASELQDILAGRTIVQINQSLTCRVGAVRGLHYQTGQQAEMKLVRCIRGEVWDVAVDLRHGSPTFLQWHGERLSADNARMLVIPEGFAHGFQVLQEESELLYLTTAIYSPDAEGGVNPTDERLAIRWPLPISLLSSRDSSHPPLATDFSGLSL